MKTFKEFITEEDDTFEHMFQQLDLKIYTVSMNMDQLSIVEVDILDVDTFISIYNQYMGISKRLTLRTPEGEKHFKPLAFYDNSLNEIIEQIRRVKCISVRYYTIYNGRIYFALTRNDAIKKVLDDVMGELYNTGYDDDGADREGKKILDELQDKFNELE